MSNQELNFLYVLLFIGFGFLFLLILIISSYVNHAVKESEKEITKYKKELSEIRRKRDRIKSTAAIKWPIWPRPILFYEIDQSTQLALANLERDAEVIEKIAQAIRPIDPLPSNIQKVLGVKDNIRRLIIHYRNKRKLSELRRRYQDIRVAVQTVDENRKRINILKRKVEKRVEKLSVDFANTRTNISYFQGLGVKRYQDASKNLKTVQNCIEWAERATIGVTRDDMVEWAASDLLCQIGSISLSVFSLKGRSYTFSDNYEPNLVLSELSGLTADIKSALDKTNLYDWKSLKLLSNQIQLFSKVFKRAEALLIDFEGDVQDFQNLIDRLKVIDISVLHHNAHTLEDDLADYIGSPSDSSDIWKRNIGDQVLPSESILFENAHFKQTIQPLIQGTIIKQSDLHQINLSLQRFLENMQYIQNRITLVQELLTHYRKCESEVKDRLSEHGQTTLSVRKLDGFISNSTNEIMKASQNKLRQYQKIKERAYGVRNKANFPGLLEDLKILEDECKRLVVDHSNVIQRLQEKAQEQRRNLIQLIDDFRDLQQRPPYIQLDWDQIIQELSEVEQTYEYSGNNYHLLNRFVYRSRKILDEKSVLRKEVNKQHSTFQSLYKQIDEKINAADKKINVTINKLSTSWNTPLAKHVQALSDYQIQYATLDQQLQSTKKDLTMDAANITCNTIIQRLDMLDKAMDRESKLGLKRKDELDRMQKDIDNLFRNKHVAQAHPAEIELARKNNQLAREAEDPKIAIFHLNQAISILRDAHVYLPQPIQISDNRRAISLFGDQIQGIKVGRISNLQDKSQVNLAARDVSQTKKHGSRGKRK